MLMYSEIRTIKPTDSWIYESRDSQTVSQGKAQARAALQSLKAQQASLQKDLASELSQPRPNMQRVGRIRHILGNIAQSLTMHHR